MTSATADLQSKNKGDLFYKSVHKASGRAQPKQQTKQSTILFHPKEKEIQDLTCLPDMNRRNRQNKKGFPTATAQKRSQNTDQTGYHEDSYS